MPLVLLLAFALRVFRLGYQELRGDEALGRLFTLEPFGKIIASTISLREPHPVASYFVEKTWLGLAGHSEFALRFASLWFGVLAVALLYRLGRRLGLGWTASMLAAALLALSPYAIWHSQDARMYSMSLALTTASTLLMLEAIARRRLVCLAGLHRCDVAGAAHALLRSVHHRRTERLRDRPGDLGAGGAPECAAVAGGAGGDGPALPAVAACGARHADGLCGQRRFARFPGDVGAVVERLRRR